MKKNAKNKRSGYRNPAAMQGTSYAPAADTAVQSIGDAQVQGGADDVHAAVHDAESPAERMVLQFGNCEVSVTEIREKVKKSFLESSNDAEIKKVDIYVKPEDNRAYYVINGEVEGSVELVEN